MQRSELPELDWSKGEQRLPEWMVERYGYAKARRIGVVAMVGGKDKTKIRNATPLPFRDVLVGIARSVSAITATEPEDALSELDALTAFPKHLLAA